MRSFVTMFGCLLVAACVDTSTPPLPRNSAPDAGRYVWDAAGGTDIPPTAVTAAAAGPSQVGGAGAARAHTSGRAAAGGAPSSSSAGVPARGRAGAMAAGSGGSGDAAAQAVEPVAADAAPTPSKPGDLVITELMVDPQALADTQGEWFELYNATAASLSLRLCQLDDGAKALHNIVPPLVVAPGAYVTVARHAQPGFRPDATTTMSLSNAADSLALVCEGTLIDRVTYDRGGGYMIAPGVSLSLDHAQRDAAHNDSPSAWCQATDGYGADRGTPGRANPPCHADGMDAGAPDTN